MIGLLKVRYITNWHPSWTIDLPNDFLDMGHFVLCRLVEFRGYRTHFWNPLAIRNTTGPQMNDCLPLSCRQNAHQTVRLCVAHVQQNGTSSTNIFPTRKDIVPLRCFHWTEKGRYSGWRMPEWAPTLKTWTWNRHVFYAFLWLGMGWWDGGMVETRSAGGENQKAAGNSVCSFNSLINPWFKKMFHRYWPILSAMTSHRTWNSFQLWLWRNSWPEGGVWPLGFTPWSPYHSM